MRWTLPDHVDSRGAVTLLVQADAKKPLEVNAPGQTIKEIRLRVTRYLRSLHACQPCRDGVTIRTELTSSASNAGEFEKARYPGKALVVHPNKHKCHII